MILKKIKKIKKIKQWRKNGFGKMINFSIAFFNSSMSLSPPLDKPVD